MKVAVYGICKNEEANVEGWLANATQHSDHILLLDTGSTDHTVMLANEWRNNYLDRHDNPVGITIQRATVRPWRFDVAHNVALSMLPAEEQMMCIPLALDERIMTNLGDMIRLHMKIVSGQPTRLKYSYDYRPDFCFIHDRIHSRFGYTWRYPFHEAVYAYGDIPEKGWVMPDQRIVQSQSQEVDRMARDNELMRVALREYPDDRRMMFMCGRQLHFMGQHAGAIDLFKKYLNTPGPSYPLEEASVCDWMSAAIRAQGANKNATLAKLAEDAK